MRKAGNSSALHYIVEWKRNHLTHILASQLMCAHIVLYIQPKKLFSSAWGWSSCYLLQQHLHSQPWSYGSGSKLWKNDSVLTHCVWPYSMCCFQSASMDSQWTGQLLIIFINGLLEVSGTCWAMCAYAAATSEVCWLVADLIGRGAAQWEHPHLVGELPAVPRHVVYTYTNCWRGAVGQMRAV